MKGIYEFVWNYRRMGKLSGMFIADSEDVKNIIGKTVHFGEVLGKHSEIYVDMDEKDITLKTDDQDFIYEFEALMGEGFSTGYNPFDYWEPDVEDHRSSEDDSQYEILNNENS